MRDKLGCTQKVELTTPQFEVLRCIQEGLSIIETAKYRKVQRSAVYKIVRVLIKRSLLRYPKKSIYELTSKGIQGVHQFVALKYKLRQHNFHFKIEVLESPKNWEQKRNEIRQMPYFNRTIKLKNNEQDLINYGNLLIRSTTKSIIIKMPTIYSTDWEDAVIQGMQILEDQIYKIEDKFKIRLIKNYKANIKIISQEYARIQDALAKLYRTEGNRIYLTGDDGKIWLITDLSFSTDELEVIHPERATDDLDAIAPMLDDLRRNPTTFSQERELVSQKLKVVDGLLHNEIKHQAVLDKIYEMMRRLEKRLDEAGI